jgi:hypothetical protein
MTSPFEPVELAALLSLPPRGVASLPELVVDAAMTPSHLREGLRLLQRRNLVEIDDETPARYRLTIIGRSVRRALESSRTDALSGPAIMLDKQESEGLRAAKSRIDSELDQAIGPIDSESD